MATLFDSASLVMVPSGYKDDKLYSIKPTNGDGDFTFSRDGSGASPATRVNASGLIEKGRTNEVLQSNDFSVTWTASNVTGTSGYSGYDGSNDAWKLEKYAASGFVRQFVSVSGVYTFSVYAKAGSLNWIRLFMAGGVSGTSYFDLQNGVVGTTGGSPIDAKIESIGSGWYRCSVTHNDSSFSNFRIYPADADNDTSGTSGYILIQDAQLEQGLVATDYIETTTAAVSAGLLGDMPRLDYSGGATCPSLLLEPSRVNSDPNSEYLANKPIVTNVSVTTNSTTSPEGVVNASTITNNTTSGQHQLTDNTFSVTSGTNYTISLFLKYNDAQYVRLQFGGTPFGSTNWQNFDVLNGTKGSSGGGITSADASIEDYGNGWYRCILTADATATGSNGAFQIRILEDDNTSDVPSFAGTGLSTYAFGAQFESGSYPTSYIPTYGSASTRGADSCSKTSATALIGQTEGTILCEINTSTKTLSSSWAFSVNDGTTSNYIGLRRSGGNEFFAHINVAGSTTALIGTGITSGVHKIAIAYANNDIQVYVDGASVGTDTSSAIPATSVIELGDLISNRYLDDSIKQFVTFPTRLTNAELAALTA